MNTKTIRKLSVIVLLLAVLLAASPSAAQTHLPRDRREELVKPGFYAVIPLHPGRWNVVGWTADTVPVEKAIASVRDHVVLMYQFNNETYEWDGVWDAARPPFLNTLTCVRWGSVLYIKVDAECTLRYGVIVP